MTAADTFRISEDQLQAAAAEAVERLLRHEIAVRDIAVIDAVVDHVRARFPDLDPKALQYAEFDHCGHTQVVTTVTTHVYDIEWNPATPQARLGMCRIPQTHLAGDPFDAGLSIATYLTGLAMRRRWVGPLNRYNARERLAASPERPTFTGTVADLLDADAEYRTDGRQTTLGYTTPAALARDMDGTLWLDTYAGAGSKNARRTVLVAARQGMPASCSTGSTKIGVRLQDLPPRLPLPHHDGLTLVHTMFAARDDRRKG